MSNQVNSNKIMLKKIGSSNNSVIMDVQDISGHRPISTGKVLKMIEHTQENIHCTQCEQLQNEAKFLHNLSHPNIIMCGQLIQNNSGFCILELEKAESDLFYGIQSKILNINIIRTLFRGFLQGILYLHSLNIAHNDIKIDNLFIFKNNKLEGDQNLIGKIADFGFTTQNQILDSLTLYKNWKFRNRNNLAPEILTFLQDQSKIFCLKKNDIFALGISLFEAIFRRNAYAGNDGKQFSQDDNLYKHFYEKEPMKFWTKIIQDQNCKNILSYYKSQENSKLSDLFDLISKMIAVDPAERFSAQQALNHAWFN